MNAAPAQGPDTAKLVVAVGALAIGGYLAYKYWYLPQKMRDDLARYIASTGLPPKDALARLGAAGCQAYGAAYGIPPQASGGICSELAGAASDLVKQFPQLLNSTGMAAGNVLTYLGGGAGNAINSIGSGIGGGAKGILTGVAEGTQATLNVPLNTAARVYSGTKTVVQDITHGIEHVFGSIF